MCNKHCSDNAAATEKQLRNTALLACYFCIAQLVPNMGLAYTEAYSVWAKLSLLLLPLGFFMLWNAATKRSGVMIIAAFPLTFLCAFQIVLLYLFGGSIIATDMFTNVLTTNPGEATELLGNIYPAVIFVCVLYLPMLWWAGREWYFHREISLPFRKKTAAIGGVAMGLGLLSLIPAYAVSEDKRVVKEEIFPANVIYNLGLSISEYNKTRNFDETSREFTYHATRNGETPEKEIYVYVIGEASRAMNWQLLGYPRETNPRLSKTEGVVMFSNLLTQSNTTHKSVPMILSSVATDEHEELYRRKGLPALFNEAGFETWFISNQSPQGAMIDNLAHDAMHVEYMGNPRFDCQMIECMKKHIENSSAQKMLFVLHSYGSHFSYHQRYPREFAHFTPDDDVAISAQHIDILRNSYDNSIRYTDHFLAETIAYLSSLKGVASALLYCADHGEDLLDDSRHRFLHASPTTTAYQLWVASLAWFSKDYEAFYPQKVATAREHAAVDATSHSLFHTMADIASISSPYVKENVALTSEAFDHTLPRRYLNDHNHAVPFIKTGLKAEDLEFFKQHGISVGE